MLRGIFGVNGVVLPPERVLHFDAEGLAWTLAALAIAFFTPSTQQWMRAFLDSETYTVRPMSERWRALEWRPSPGWAMAMGLLSVGAVASIWRPSVFLYFQF